MTTVGFSCSSRTLTTPRDWISLIHEIVGEDSDTVEVASAVMQGPHLLRTWDIWGDDAPRVAEVATAVEQTLRDYTACWASGFYKCLVIRARSDVQLLRSRVLSVTVAPCYHQQGVVTDCHASTTIELPADLIRSIEDYLDSGKGSGDLSGLGALNAVAHIGERVAALWSGVRRLKAPVSEASPQDKNDDGNQAPNMKRAISRGDS